MKKGKMQISSLPMSRKSHVLKRDNSNKDISMVGFNVSNSSPDGSQPGSKKVHGVLQ